MRTPAITRRVIGHTAHCLVFDLEEMNTREMTVAIPKAYDANETTRLKYIDKYYKDAVNMKFLMVQSWDEIDKYLGLKWDDFLRYAVELDDKRRFPDGSEADEKSE